MNFYITSLLIVLLYACTPVGQTSTGTDNNTKNLELRDKVYEPQIKTVRLYPSGAPLQPAVTAMGQWNLYLEFDDLRADRDSYYAKIIHCNYDWTQSNLQDLDFMSVYNEFPINNAEFSVDTHVPYIRYWLTLPAVKYPGNYVVVVYRGSNKDDIILSRRFMVFDSQITFSRTGKLLGSGNVADLSQQINFTINYENLNILNPMQDVHVDIRQNQRWDNMATDLKPSFARDIEKELEYRFFDDNKLLKGGNEFRFFDLRSLNYPGRNVDYVDKKVKPFEVYLGRDVRRADKPYAQYNDNDGAYIIENYDYNDIAFTNYAYVNFTLESPPVKGDVYLIGAFNYWNTSDENKMRYDSTKGVYRARYFLKQGWYDYQYRVKSSQLPPYYFEGSFYQTENLYEIFVYYRAFQPRADLLVGYIQFEENPR
jgi:hypothetical protein